MDQLSVTGGDARETLKAFIAHWEAGDKIAALKSAREACHAAPCSPEAHYAHGQAVLALGDPSAAQRAFAVTLELRPSWADAWVNYGVACYQLGAIHAAKAAMREAITRQPGHAAATANLGAFLRITGEVEAAEELLVDCLSRAPDSHGARLNLVAELLSQERSSDALALLAQGREPDDQMTLRHWLLEESLALLQMNRLAEARLALGRLARLGPLPPQLAPLWHWRYVLLRMLEGDRPAAMASAASMAAALQTMGSEAVVEHRVMGHYDLAKFWSYEGDSAKAFAHWKEGHRLLRFSQPFSRDGHRVFVEASIAAFPRVRFIQGQRAANVDATPVFIVGMPRSGTTLCERILAAHRDVFGAGERVALERCFALLGHGEFGRAGGIRSGQAVRCITEADSTRLDAAANGYLADLHALAPDALRITDKMPSNALYLGLVGLLLPEARIINCVRDPRDIGLSIFTFRFHGEHGYAHDLADLGWTISQNHRLMEHWRKVLPNPMLTVHLTDWVRDFEGTLNRILDFLDLPYDPDCARFYMSEARVRTVSRTQVRQPVNARGIDRWQGYRKELAPLIEELEAGGLLPY